MRTIISSVFLLSFLSLLGATAALAAKPLPIPSSTLSFSASDFARSELSLIWRPVEFADRYVVYEKKLLEADDWLLIWQGDASSLSLDVPEAPFERQYKIQACNAAGCSEFVESNIVRNYIGCRMVGCAPCADFPYCDILEPDIHLSREKNQMVMESARERSLSYFYVEQWVNDQWRFVTSTVDTVLDINWDDVDSLTFFRVKACISEGDCSAFSISEDIYKKEVTAFLHAPKALDYSPFGWLLYWQASNSESYRLQYQSPQGEWLDIAIAKENWHLVTFNQLAVELFRVRVGHCTYGKCLYTMPTSWNFKP